MITNTQKALIRWYLDWMNNYAMLDKFAEHNGISFEFAQIAVREGRRIWQELNKIADDGNKVLAKELADIDKEIKSAIDKNNLNNGVYLIGVERLRQITSEGYTISNDAEFYKNDELLDAAYSYILACVYTRIDNDFDKFKELAIEKGTWPFNDEEGLFKPSKEDKVRNLVKAGALIAAEIDRILYVKNNEKHK